jgi:hypothetical protein
MSNASSNSFFSVLEEMGHTFTKGVRHAVRSVATMSWPALLLSCILLAMVITIVPLVIFLFVIFMCIKLVATSIAQRSKRGPATPYREHAAPAARADDVADVTDVDTGAGKQGE